MRAPRAAIVLWQSIALAAVLSAFSAAIAIASRLFAPGPDGRPTATITSEIDVLGWPVWTVYVLVLAITLVIGARLVTAVLQVAIATRRRRAHHRMMVDLLDMSHESTPPQVCAQVWGHLPRAGDGLRILDVKQPLAYCLPGVRSRVVVSEGTLKTLSDSEITAILTHERAHLRARHDLVLEMFTAVHAAFPRFVRSGNALDAVRLLIEMLADDAAVRAAGPTPLARALVACASGRTPSGALAVRRSDHVAAGAPPRRAAEQPGPCRHRLPRRGRRARRAYPGAGGAVADRTTPTVHRVSAPAVKTSPPQQKNERPPE